MGSLVSRGGDAKSDFNKVNNSVDVSDATAKDPQPETAVNKLTDGPRDEMVLCLQSGDDQNVFIEKDDECNNVKEDQQDCHEEMQDDTIIVPEVTKCKNGAPDTIGDFKCDCVLQACDVIEFNDAGPVASSTPETFNGTASIYDTPPATIQKPKENSISPSADGCDEQTRVTTCNETCSNQPVAFPTCDSLNGTASYDFKFSDRELEPFRGTPSRKVEFQHTVRASRLAFFAGKKQAENASNEFVIVPSSMTVSHDHVDVQNNSIATESSQIKETVTTDEESNVESVNSCTQIKRETDVVLPRIKEEPTDDNMATETASQSPDTANQDHYANWSKVEDVTLLLGETLGNCCNGKSEQASVNNNNLFSNLNSEFSVTDDDQEMVAGVRSNYSLRVKVKYTKTEIVPDSQIDTKINNISEAKEENNTVVQTGNAQPQVNETPTRGRKTKFMERAVEEFLEKYENPVDHFYNTDRSVTSNYVALGKIHLSNEFPLLHKTHLNTVLKKYNYHLIPAYREIEAIFGACGGRKKLRSYPAKKSPSRYQPLPELLDESFCEDIDFLMMEDAIKQRLQENRDLLPEEL